MMRHLAVLVLLAAFLTAAPDRAYAAPAKAAQPQGDPRSLELNEQGMAAIEAKDLALAEQSFRKALTADSGNLTAAFNLAGVYLALKRPKEAIDLLTSYTKRDPKDAGLYARLGDALFSSRDVKGALANYERALELEPGYPNIAARLGTLYSLENRFDDAERMFRAASEQNPNDTETLLNLSNVLLQNGGYPEALELAKRATQLQSSARAYVTLGNAYEATQDPRNALAAFERAIALGDKTPEVAERAAALRRHLS